MLGTAPESAVCKESIIPTVLSLWPQNFKYYQEIIVMFKDQSGGDLRMICSARDQTQDGRLPTRQMPYSLYYISAPNSHSSVSTQR